MEVLFTCDSLTQRVKSIYNISGDAQDKVSPIKRLTIPRLELCGPDDVLARLLYKVKEILHIPLSAWTDSTIVLSWLRGNPRRFKTYVGNRVSDIVDKIPPERWNHVVSSDNPADCTSRGIFPSEQPSLVDWPSLVISGTVPVAKAG